MECPRCHSHRLVKFVDPFGVRRVFCRDCYLSMPEHKFVQTNLAMFNPSMPRKFLPTPHPSYTFRQ